MSNTTIGGSLNYTYPGGYYGGVIIGCVYNFNYVNLSNVNTSSFKLNGVANGNCVGLYSSTTKIASGVTGCTLT